MEIHTCNLSTGERGLAETDLCEIGETARVESTHHCHRLVPVSLCISWITFLQYESSFYLISESTNTIHHCDILYFYENFCTFNLI